MTLLSFNDPERGTHPLRISRRQTAVGLLTAAAMTGLPSMRARAQGMPSDALPIDETPTEVGTEKGPYDHMLAPVTINGQGPFQFLIDTGSNASCVSRALAERLSLSALPSARVRTAVGARQRPAVLIDHLQVGERTRKAVHAPAMPFDKGLDGVLGVDWLNGQRLELNFKGKTLAIARSKDDPPAAGVHPCPPRDGPAHDRRRRSQRAQDQRHDRLRFPGDDLQHQDAGTCE